MCIHSDSKVIVRQSLGFHMFFLLCHLVSYLMALVHRCFDKVHLYDNWNVPNNFCKIKGIQTCFIFLKIIFNLNVTDECMMP